MIRQELIDLGFKELPHFSIMNSLIYDLGRNRQLSIGSIGTPNEMMFICELDENTSTKITDLVCIHNYDYDGYMTMNRLKHLLTGLNK
jgi:hypothetical protein